MQEEFYNEQIQKAEALIHDSFYKTFLELVKSKVGDEFFQEAEKYFLEITSQLDSNAIPHNKALELEKILTPLRPLFIKREAIQSAHLGDFDETIKNLHKLKQICEKCN